MSYANPDAAIAESRVSGPGTAMLVMGILGMLAAVVFVLIQLFSTVMNVDMAYSDEEQMGAMLGGTAGVFMYIFEFIVSIIVAVAGWKMKSLESYPLAMTGTIAMMIPCCSAHPCCWPLGLGFGIWSLVTLMDDDVKSAFE